jgi:hypothetical protein
MWTPFRPEKIVLRAHMATGEIFTIMLLTGIEWRIMARPRFQLFLDLL